jgi:hypothetical protein
MENCLFAANVCPGTTTEIVFMVSPGAKESIPELAV